MTTNLEPGAETTETGSDPDEEELCFSRGTDEVLIKIDAFDSITRVYGELLDSGRLSDVEVTCRGRSYALHGVVLVSHSSFFYRLLVKQLPPPTSISVDFDPDLFRLCLQYMYHGRIEVQPEIAFKLGELAEKLEMPVFFGKCIAAAYSDVDIVESNCLEKWVLGLRAHDASLVAKAKTCALASFSSVQHKAAFRDLPWSCVREYLGDEGLCVESEEERLMAALLWVRADTADRTGHLPDLLSSLPLSSMKSWFLTHTLHDPVITECPDAVSILERATKPQQEDNTTKPSEDQTEPCLIIPGPVSDSPSSNAGSLLALPLSLKSPAWTLATLPADLPHDNAAASCAVGPRFYISGLGPNYNQVWSCDLTEPESWTRCGDLSESRQGHCMAVCDDEVYALGGHVPRSRDRLVCAVERMERAQWCRAGGLQGVSCNNCCHFVQGTDIIVYGAASAHGNLLQVYSTQSQQVTATMLVPYGCPRVNGVLGLSDDYIVMCDDNAVFLCSQDGLYGRHDAVAGIRTLTNLRTRSLGCVMVPITGTATIMSVGGWERTGQSVVSEDVYTVGVKELVQGRWSGWRCAVKGGGVAQGLIWPGACTVAAIHVNNSAQSTQ